MLDGTSTPMPRLYFGVVDVRDAAALHVRAMTNPKAAGERFLATSGDAITYRQVSEIIADRLGPRISGLPITEMSDDQVREAARTVPSLRDAATRVGKIPVIKTDKAGEILGWAPRGVPETIVDTAKSLLALAGTAA